VSPNAVQVGAFAAEEILRERCILLGLPFWHFDAVGTLHSEPVGIGALARFYRTGYMRSLAIHAVSEIDQKDQGVVLPAFEGAWFMVVPEFDRRRIVGISLSMTMSHGAFDTDEFARACHDAGVSIEDVSSALAPVAIYTDKVTRNTVDLLKWSSDDLRSLSRKNDLVMGFSQQLSDTFEEISLFYTLGQSMNELAHPEKFVNVACKELHEALSYGWVAAAFVDDQFLVRGMAGKLTTSGALPCVDCEFEYGVRGLLAQLSPSSPSVLKPEQAGVLGSDGMQVLVRPVIYDGNVVDRKSVV